MNKERIGERHLTNKCGWIEIIEYFNHKKVTIKFDYGGYIKFDCLYSNIIRGEIFSNEVPSLFGVGYIGTGNYSIKKDIIVYKKWYSMLCRCYDTKTQEKQPTYIGCSVSSIWFNFQNFCEWFYEPKNMYSDGFHIDKDILFKGNKIYSPKKCCFVPKEINQLIVNRQNFRGLLPLGVTKTNNNKMYVARILIDGVRIHLGSFETKELAFNSYKIAKEKQIKLVSEKWKPSIPENVYQAMNDYKVEITD